MPAKARRATCCDLSGLRSVGGRWSLVVVVELAQRDLGISVAKRDHLGRDGGLQRRLAVGRELRRVQRGQRRAALHRRVVLAPAPRRRCAASASARPRGGTRRSPRWPSRAVCPSTAEPSSRTSASLTRSVSAGSFTSAFAPSTSSTSGSLRRVGRGRLGLHVAPDGRQQALPHGLRERADRELQLHLVGDDVVLRAAVDRADRDHRGVERRVLARDDRLQRQHHARGDHHGIDRGLGPRAVAAAAEDRDVDAVGVGQDRTRRGSRPRRRAAARRRASRSRSRASETW